MLALLLALTACTRAHTPTPTPIPTPIPTSTPLATPTAEPASRLTRLPLGPPPRITYADDGVLVHPDGRRERVHGQQRIGVSAFLRFRGGYLLADTRFFEGTVGLAYVRDRRRVDLGPCASGGAVLSGDGRLVAWLTQACPETGQAAPTVVHVVPLHGVREERREIDRVGIIGVVGFLADDVVVSGPSGGVQRVAPSGATELLPHLASARDVSRGLVAGLLPGGDAHGAVLDSRTGRLLWQRRGTSPQALSPDGSHLADMVGRRTTILDARTGVVVATADPPWIRVEQVTWEDDEHLLAVAYHGEEQTLVRIDLAGAITRIGPVVAATGYRYAFETRP